MIERPARAVPGRADIQGLQLLESCSFTWIFDGATHRFRRVPRNARVSMEVPAQWAQYHQLEIDESRSCFVVELDREGIRILRAWLHVDPCVRCRRDDSSLGDLQLRILSWKQRLRSRDPRVGAPRDSGRHPLRPFGGWALAGVSA
jgi:hypothetical protein